MKKRSRRSNDSHPDTKVKYTLKRRADLLDQDYYHKLSDKELDWINKFNKETISASFDEERPRKNLHKKKTDRLELYKINNQRNHDIVTRQKASGDLVYFDDALKMVEDGGTDLQTALYAVEDVLEYVFGFEIGSDVDFNYEDTIINKIDAKSIQESLDWLETTLDTYSEIDKKAKEDSLKEAKPSKRKVRRRRSR